jgi:hypothetical protein
MLETPKAQYAKDAKMIEIHGQSAGKKDMLTKDLAYATGLLLGDGCLSVIPNNHAMTLHKSTMMGSMDKDVMEEFHRILKENFGCNSNIKENNNFYTYSTSKGIVFDYFSFNTAFKTKFPDDIWNSEKSIQLDFLSGLLDSDGFASFTHSPEGKDKKGRLVKARDQFRMGFTNTRFIMEMTELLDRLHIKYGKLWANNHQTEQIKFRKVGKQLTRYTIPINAMSFVEQGGYFKCQRKQSRLEKYLHLMKTCYFEPHRLNAERLLMMV